MGLLRRKAVSPSPRPRRLSSKSKRSNGDSNSDQSGEDRRKKFQPSTRMAARDTSPLVQLACAWSLLSKNRALSLVVVVIYTCLGGWGPHVTSIGL